MKRVIDIEEDYYEMIKYNVEHEQKYKPWEIIANSIPYEERPQDCSDCKRYDSPYFEVKFDKEQMQELVDKAKAEVLASIEITQVEWIPVSERLPEQSGFYITTCRDICENRVHTVGFDGVRKKWVRGGVIAWQPLPEPYKKEGDEE